MSTVKEAVDYKAKAMERLAGCSGFVLFTFSGEGDKLVAHRTCDGVDVGAMLHAVGRDVAQFSPWASKKPVPGWPWMPAGTRSSWMPV